MESTGFRFGDFYLITSNHDVCVSSVAISACDGGGNAQAMCKVVAGKVIFVELGFRNPRNSIPIRLTTIDECIILGS